LDGFGKKLGFGRSHLGKVPAAKGGRRTRALWLLPATAVLMLAAAAAFNGSPVSQAGLGLLMTALQDPMALFSQRSPGKRSGPLVSIKGKTGPRERVLASVRDRPTPQIADIPAVVLDMPPVVDIPPGTFSTPPQPTITPTEIIGSPYVPTTPFSTNIPGFIPGETPPPLVATAPPDVPPPTSLLLPPPTIGSNPPETPPSQTPPGVTPGSPPGTTPGTPPSTPPETPPGTTPGGPIVLPEPSSWSVMIMGLIATGFVRRRKRKAG
jgi:hypothetical protein